MTLGSIEERLGNQYAYIGIFVLLPFADTAFLQIEGKNFNQ